MKIILYISSIIMLIFLKACEPERQKIFYGEEECAHCSMIISERQFAGQLVTTKGRHYNFDAIECLAAFIETGNIDQEDMHSAWVPGFNEDTWMLADKAHFLRSRTLASPMSLNLSAYRDREIAEEYRRNYTGDILTWTEIKNLVRQEWFNRN